MNKIKVQFLGCGDAFGSGGRYQTCIFVQSASSRFLLDCGASSLSAMKRWGLDPTTIDIILITHLHGDHFGGLPFFLLEAQLVSKRAQPLVIAGPPGLVARVRQAMEVLFPGSFQMQPKFSLEFIELPKGEPTRISGLVVTPYQVVHASGAPPYALRVKCDGKVIAYSGDTEWTDNLLPAANGADLFICEASYFDKTIKYHLNYEILMARRAALGCRRLVVTHMSDDMLAKLDDLELEYAEDGKEFSI